MQKRNCPIGVFDSGLGGLTVLKELMRQLPCEDLIYFGDTARVPYGTKSKESIIQFSKENAAILFRYGVKMIVVACNSSSSYAIEILKKKFPVPVVGVICPGAKRAIEMTKNKKIGVIATSATINSGKYEKAIYKIDSKVKVFNQACPLFVPLVEEGWFEKKVTVDIASEYLSGLKRRGVDVVILGCTHYPLLKKAIQKVLGEKIILVDSAKKIAEEVKGILSNSDLIRNQNRRGKQKFLISDKPQAFNEIAKKFLGREIKGVKYV